MTREEFAIRENEAEGRWELVAHGETAWMSFTRGPRVLVLVHTEVPESLGGRGIAGRLARHAMDLAKSAGLQVEAVCPFMISWLERHEEYAELLFKPAGPAADEPFWF